ncbi:Hypothetical predicted protein [Mytilus galloprovincialis]|uniref:THAP-type domain-containing protein n=1 Tax=Mytilus galloprovincialis TaxID=29158 RepID=A0A8B6E121_MYTGA|nr:Hypothetical predicted protein [Mytilus galloprovincialis]
MSCQVYGCSVRQGYGKSLHRFPDPTKKKELYQAWLCNLNLTSNSFIFSKHKLVCEDHFEKSCFETDLMGRLLGFTNRRPRLRSDAVPTVFACNQDTREDSNLQTRKRVLNQIPVPLDNVAKEDKWNSALTECKENNIPKKKIRQGEKAEQENIGRPSKPLMVDVSVQTLTPSQLQTDLDIGTSMTNNSYLQMPVIPAQPLDTAFISSPKKDQDTSDASTPSPPPSPDKTDSDCSYVPSDESHDSNQSTSPDSQHITTEPKIIAFESCLRALFSRVVCTECGEPISSDESTILYNGTAMKVKFLCMRGHQSSWESQPLVNSKPAGNLMVATAIILSGETFSRISHFADILSLKFIGQTQYYSIQKDIAIPAIDHYYSLQREVVLQQLQGKQLVLGGDGRCDSPGYSAKYCTYTFMDTLTGVIPDFSLVQVNETTSSTKMELIGFQRSLSNIEDANLAVDVVVTDRHVQIRKAMATDHSDKNHQFDVWHLSKSVKKKILAIKPKKLLTEVKPWIPSICNHVWWCSREAKGNPDKLEETWTSLLYHISNRHTFPGKLVTKCGHPPLSADAIRKKKWLPKDSPAYEALEKVITNKLILRDIRHLDRFCHTGSLETYHSMMLKYCPKRLEFDYPSMVARTQLAVVDNNVNIGRKQKTGANGMLSFTTRCPKSTGRWTARKVYEKKEYDFKTDILHSAIKNQQEGTKKKTLHQLKSLTLPRNISKDPTPCKEDLVDSHRSRFF